MSQNIREGQFFPKSSWGLKSNPVHSILDWMAQTYCLANRYKPRLTCIPSAEQLWGYLSVDPGGKQRLLLPLPFFILSIKSLLDKSPSSYFFVIKSCEYVKVSGARKSKLLTIKNIHFYKYRMELCHSNPFLHLADCVAITFEHQKRVTKITKSINHHSHDYSLCPVQNLGPCHQKNFILPVFKAQ